MPAYVVPNVIFHVDVRRAELYAEDRDSNLGGA